MVVVKILLSKRLLIKGLRSSILFLKIAQHAWEVKEIARDMMLIFTKIYAIIALMDLTPYTVLKVCLLSYPRSSFLLPTYCCSKILFILCHLYALKSASGSRQEVRILQFNKIITSIITFFFKANYHFFSYNNEISVSISLSQLPSQSPLNSSLTFFFSPRQVV